MRKKLAVLISDKGTGTNLQTIINGVIKKIINASIVVVISDTGKAQGLLRAKRHKIKTVIVPKKKSLMTILKKHNPDFICLAGWKQIVPDEIINAFPEQILNTHPGLIPDKLSEEVKNPDKTIGLWNRGKMTDRAIQNFLDEHATYAGCSNHFLSNTFDFGRVLGRCFEKIRKNDTVETLYGRLKLKENKLYIDVLKKLCAGINVLVIGQNGREHALATSYAKSNKVNKVIMIPGNGLTDFNNPKIKNYPNVGMMDFEKIVDICKREKIDLVDVGQDNIIAAGYVDKFERLGITVFGPTKKAAQLEWDKKWAREFMVKYHLPIPKFKSFSNAKKAIKYVKGLSKQALFVKASGLALGKGAIFAKNKQAAIKGIKMMRQFGKSGKTFLIEECMTGEEFSLFTICDGRDYVIANWAQDHKRVYDGDKGSNTGGMGSIAPTGAITYKDVKIIEKKIIKPTLLGMKKEGRPYKGILYLGGIKTTNGIKIIELNCRWGDPEAEVILPSIETDYLKISEAVIESKLKLAKINFDKKVRISVAGCSKGYPDDYSKAKGKEIFGIEQAMKVSGVLIFGSGIKRDKNKFYANGGRIFYVVGEGRNIKEARKKAYQAMKLINIKGNNLYYRTDIGWRDMQRPC